MGDWATVEAVLGQVQLRWAAPQPHIQRPVWPEGVLRFDVESELGRLRRVLPPSWVVRRARSSRGTRRSHLLSVTRWIEASVRGLAAVDVRDFASDLGIHSDFSAGVLDGQ